jgi:hypothetical protein
VAGCDTGDHPLADHDVVVLAARLHLCRETLALVMTLKDDLLGFGIAVGRDVACEVPRAEFGIDLEVRRSHEPASRRRRRLLALFDVEWLDERLLPAVFFVPLERADPRFDPSFDPRFVLFDPRFT